VARDGHRLPPIEVRPHDLMRTVVDLGGQPQAGVAMQRDAVGTRGRRSGRNRSTTRSR
jgi:hypothetical protein